jgi:hypothetical protein
MIRTMLFSAAAAALVALLSCSEAHAYGAACRSTTYTNPNTGRSATVNQSAAWGPGGAAKSTSVSGSGPNGSYSASGTRAYSPTMYHGYSAGGVSSTVYGAGVVRYP